MTDQIITIRGSGLFDVEWYHKHYPDVGVVGLDPVEHYVRFGSKMRRNPGPLFDTRYYISHNPDVTQAGMNPLYHYIIAGKGEGRQIRPLPSKAPAHGEGRTLRRVAVFASYSADEKITDNVVYYVKHLGMAVDDVIFVSDNALPDKEINKLKPYITHHICERHEEYDFGSYKRGFLYALETGLLDQADQLILCNDSCYGPVFPLKTVFEKMDRMDCDFWGVTDSKLYAYHIQSYFLAFSRKAFSHEAFQAFILSVEKEQSVEDVILKYEVKFTGHLKKADLRSCALIDKYPAISRQIEKRGMHIEHYPVHLMAQGSPLIKKKSLMKAGCNVEGVDRSLEALTKHNRVLHDIVIGDPGVALLADLNHVQFSMVMATKDRAHCIADSIKSVLNQTHKNFELIIVDDGSMDQTDQLLHEKFGDELARGIIKYVKLPKNIGVCGARNVGLSEAKNPWIAYIDSDNVIRKSFLKTFAAAIVEYENTKTFYAQFCRVDDGAVGGKRFNYSDLQLRNFVDLGVFVHHVDCYREMGGFDVSLRRLVDWDLVLTYTKIYPPVFLPQILMEYSNKQDASRISVSESGALANVQVQRKHRQKPVISSVIICYNQVNYIKKAIESVLIQEGDFIHEIIISDDGSKDGTRAIIDEYTKQNHMRIRNISSDKNSGISTNFRKCFEAATGDYVAVLEGDDYWTDARKLEKQLEFMKSNKDCSMAFSKIEVHNVRNGTRKTLERQDNIKKTRLTGEDFLNDSSMNLIANFSSCMFRADLMKQAPALLFEKRISEIAVVLYLEQHGPIGFLDEVMSVYLQHPNGVWSGSDRLGQLKSGLETRRIAKEIAHPRHRDKIQKIIDEQFVAKLGVMS